MLTDFDGQPVLTVEAERWLNGPLGGGSQAHHLGCSGNTEYAVKFMGNPQGNWILAREFGFGRVARLLGDAAPEVALVNVTAEFLAISPQVPFRTPGLAFGSRWVNGTFDSKSGGARGPFVAEDLARVIVFQTWAAAQDPAALVEVTTGRIWSIDHGLYAQAGTLPAAPATGPNGPVVPGGLTMADAITRAGARIDSVLDTLESLAFPDILAAFAGTPAAWGTPVQERSEFAMFLGRRQHLVRGFLAPHRGGTP